MRNLINRFYLKNLIQKNRFHSKNFGFTLLEVLIVTGIVVILAMAGMGFYLNYEKNVEINSTTSTILSDIKKVQSKSIVGESGLKWGIHFINNTTANYYELFSTPTDYSDAGKTILETKYLPQSITFSDPALNATKDIIFSKISGATSPSSISITSQNISKMISVSNVGLVSISDVVVNGIILSKAGSGIGVVTSSPSGINCGSTCLSNFGSGTVVTLTAVPTLGSFTGWSGSGCSGSGTCVITTNSAASVTASFDASIYSLTVTKSGTGLGTVTSSPSGISCGPTCSYGYYYGTTITLTASPSYGTFTGWSGAGCSGTGNCIITISSTASVTATFTAPPCSGTRINGSCWYRSTQGTDCNTFCSSYGHGSCTNATLDLAGETNICSTLWPGSTIAGLSGQTAPRYDGYTYCFIQANVNGTSGTVVEDTCSSANQYHYNSCICSQ